ncbi:MAG: family N-acetyltransferase [Anaerocolumna sp.]|jgi:diamine N-acetyltransferase|nr:family N-acetyltransferase [Anaerocolumna sp.]
MEITLRIIDKTNWEECINLKVSEDQSNYVASNAYSLVQANYEENLYPMGIYNGDTMVGFTMYDFDTDENMWGMCRLMIDQKHQKNGIGKIAILKLMELVREKYGHVEFYTSVEPENHIALKLYEGLGFINTNRLVYEELLLTMKL